MKQCIDRGKGAEYAGYSTDGEVAQKDHHIGIINTEGEIYPN